MNKMVNIIRIAASAFLLIASVSPAISAPAKEKRPNIVVILADDFGHGHVSCLNSQSKIQTPNLDRLASDGINFTDAHSGSAVCSPTRYGLLTGRYAWRTHLKTGVLAAYDPPLIEPTRLTWPKFMQQQGYTTACIGKWHLGWDWRREATNNPDFSRPIANGPITRGFDYYFGTHVPNQPPFCFIENDRTVGLPTAYKTQANMDGKPGPMLPGWKFEGILPTITDRAVRYIEEHAKTSKPFFLYFPLTSPHEPIAPSEAFRGKSGMNALADFVIETDAVVGRILEALEKNGLEKNTLVIFTADNGSNLTTGGRELQKMGHEPSGIFRGSKRSIYEGGHRVPFFARWPGHIKADTKSEEIICLTDLFPTTAALVGARLPKDAVPDGYDILPALLGKKSSRPIREATVHQSAEGHLAIRQGPWKLIMFNPWQKPGTGSKLELYNLTDDIRERDNVAEKHPEIVKSLGALLSSYIESGRSVR